LLIDLLGIVFAALRSQAIAQPGERPSITRASLEIVTKNFLGFCRVIGGEQ
jgi:hypothetical protein